MSIEQFVEHLVRSGLVTQAEVEGFQQTLPPSKRPLDAQALARELVLAGRLTKYQAGQVYQGHTKGLMFGEYTVLDKLGQGGMGLVLKAEHRRLGRIVAVKVLPAGVIKSPEAVKRFYREVEAAGRLVHPNIVAAFDAGEQDGIHYLTMEYVDGKDLAKLTKDRRPMDIRLALDYVRQAARGLAYAHGQGVTHRDVKPSNLLLDTKGTIKILDMGLARIRRGAEIEGQASEQLTRSGEVMGTCDYMAPEQAEDMHAADHRADIYSLGCTLYRLLVGRSPYSGDSLIKILLAHRETPIPSLCDARPDVPAEVDALFQRMVAKRPEDRYQSMAEVGADLEACLGAGERPPVAALAEGAPSYALPPSLAFLEQEVAADLATHHRRTPAEETLRRAHHEASGTKLLAKAKQGMAVFRGNPWLMLGVAGGVAVLTILFAVIFSRLTREEGPTEARRPRASETTRREPAALAKVGGATEKAAGTPPSLAPNTVTAPARAAWIWVEGEKPAKSTMIHNNWYASVNREKLSGGDLISHSHASKAGEAEYVIDAAEPSEYELWIRANPSYARISCQLNEGAWRDVDIGTSVGGMVIAADDAIDVRFIAWMKVGQVALKAGANTIRFRFDHTADAPATVGHCGCLDCFVLSRGPFQPRGTLKPGEDSRLRGSLRPRQDATGRGAPATGGGPASAKGASPTQHAADIRRFSESPSDGLIWVEGEDATRWTMQRRGNWYERVKPELLSGGNLMCHINVSEPGEAEYEFHAAKAGEYEFWVRANPWADARLWHQLNEHDWDLIDLTKPVGLINFAAPAVDIRFLAWIKVGRVSLKAGTNTIRFRMDSKQSNHGYLDCFVFSPGPFQPRAVPLPAAKPEARK